MSIFRVWARFLRGILLGENRNWRNPLTSAYSQIGQDIFCIRALRFKTGGSYLEVGGFHPFHYSNSFFLEHHYGFRGVSLEIDKDRCKSFESSRKNPCLHVDALTFPAAEILSSVAEGGYVDYLSIDVEPNTANLDVLRNYICSDTRFAVVTFEHNRDRVSNEKDQIADEARKIMQQNDYLLVCGDVHLNGKATEDWYVCKQKYDQKELDVEWLKGLISLSNRDYIDVIKSSGIKS